MYWGDSWITEANFVSTYGTNHLFVICGVESLASNTNNTASVWIYVSNNKGLTNKTAFRLTTCSSTIWITTSDNTITGSV